MHHVLWVTVGGEGHGLIAQELTAGDGEILKDLRGNYQGLFLISFLALEKMDTFTTCLPDFSGPITASDFKTRSKFPFSYQYVQFKV